MAPFAEDVTAYLGKGQDSHLLALAESHLPIVTAYVRAYVRDRGFNPTTGEPGDDLAAVIVASTARLMANPEHIVEQTAGPFSVRFAIFNGWTLPELAVLNRHRKRAA